MQLPTEMEHYKSDIEDHEYQIKRYQRFNLKPNRENMGSVSKSRKRQGLDTSIGMVGMCTSQTIIPISTPLKLLLVSFINMVRILFGCFRTPMADIIWMIRLLAQLGGTINLLMKKI